MGVLFSIYNLLSSIVLIFLLPYLYLKRQKRNDGMTWLKEKFGLVPEEKLACLKGRPIWIHAVSVGEVMASMPLIKAIKERYPDKSLVLSTITDTGNLIAKEKAVGADAIVYLPFDIGLFVESALDRIRPLVFVLIETELWPNLLRTLGRKNIPSLIINGRISRRSFKGYIKIRPFMRYVLKNVTSFGMQTSSDAERIRGMGAEPSKVEVIGNIKFDQPLSIKSPGIKKTEDIFKINGRPLLVAGSTHEGEEEIILNAFAGLKKRVKDIILLIAPRHIDRVDRIGALIKERGLGLRRRTELAEKGLDDASVIILDTIGELAEIYSLASLVFVGGSLVPIGGHNILEPAVFSKPILFGQYMANFEDIAQLFLEKGAALQVSNAEQLERELEILLTDKDKARIMGEMARNVVEENRGAVERSLKMIERCLPGLK